jgi:uncharacterized membrane protein YqiK
MIEVAMYVGFFVLFIAFIYFSSIIVYVPNGKMAIVERLWSFSRGLSESRVGVVTLDSSPGYLADPLLGGFHFFFPFQYHVVKRSIPTIRTGQIGYIYARGGKALPPNENLARDVGVDYTSVKEFAEKGGVRGLQRAILREGQHIINTAQFIILQENGLDIADNHNIDEITKSLELIAERDGFKPITILASDNSIGIVTVHDGQQLSEGQIIAPPVSNASVFGSPQAFIDAGGFRGVQQTPLLDGTHYLNRMFATVDFADKTQIDVGFVGVVVAYVGAKGEDTSGHEYRHGELVAEGFRGVWEKPLMPGKYPLNTQAYRISTVPTTNFILKWNSDATGSDFDQNLKDISLITKDAFEPNLTLSVVVAIDYLKAPLVIQRFGDVKQLVEQTLDPMVSAHFKNVAQSKTLIQLLQERTAIQADAKEKMSIMFASYSLTLQEVLIGTPRSSEGEIERILDQLRSRQIAVEQVETFKQKAIAAESERSANEAKAIADQQATLTASNISIKVKENEGKAMAEASTQEALKIERLAQAEANSVKFLAAAEAQRIESVGEANANAAKKQVAAMGGAEFRLNQEIATVFANAIREAKLPIVPQISIGANSGDSLQNLLSAFMSGKLLENKDETQINGATKSKA